LIEQGPKVADVMVKVEPDRGNGVGSGEWSTSAEAIADHEAPTS
jgi:hypothetical protein